MKIEKLIKDWIVVSNSYNTEKYLSFYGENAILDDRSVGRKFSGKNGIREYFKSYFIGYKTQTKIVQLLVEDENNAHLEVEFTGDFPEGKIGGTFDFTCKYGIIEFLSADLIS